MLGNVIPGSDWIPGSINTTPSAAKTLSSTRSEVSAKLKLSQLSTVFNIAKEKLVLDLTLCKNGNCGEWLSQSQLFLAVSTVDCCDRDSFTFAKTLNYGKCFSSRMAKGQCSAT